MRSYFRYALGIDLPDFVAEDLVIQSLNEYAIDLVTWTNVSRDSVTGNKATTKVRLSGHFLSQRRASSRRYAQYDCHSNEVPQSYPRECDGLCWKIVF